MFVYDGITVADEEIFFEIHITNPMYVKIVIFFTFIFLFFTVKKTVKIYNLCKYFVYLLLYLAVGSYQNICAFEIYYNYIVYFDFASPLDIL